MDHPIWCALYALHVLPSFMVIKECQWPAPYMAASLAASLAAYLLHHKKLLERIGLWQQHAEEFVKRHPTAAS